MGNFECGQCFGGGLCKECNGTGQVGDARASLLQILRSKRVDGSVGLGPQHFELLGLPATTGIEYEEINLPEEIATRSRGATSFPLDVSGIVTTFPGSTQYGKTDEQRLPPEAIWSTEFANHTTLPATQQLNVGEATSTTDTLTLTVSHGVTTNNNISMNIGYPPYFGTSFAHGESFVVSNTTTHTQTQMKQRTWNYTASIPIGPNKTVRIQLTLTKSIIALPFKAAVQVRGQVKGINPLAHIRLGIVIQPTPTDDTLPVGVLFRNSPHPKVIVINDDTISCELSGTIVGIIGTDLVASASEVQGGQPMNSIDLFRISDNVVSS